MREISRASKSALVMLTLSLWFATVYAAPAPLPTRSTRARLPVRCVLHWHGGAYQAAFSTSGHYTAWNHQQTWHGTWRLEGRRLVVEERPDGSQAAPFSWSVELDGRLRRGPGVTLDAR